MYQSPDWVKFVLDKPMALLPGSRMFGQDNSFPILFYLFEKGYLIPLYPPLSKGGYIFPPFGKACLPVGRGGGEGF